MAGLETAHHTGRIVGVAVCGVYQLHYVLVRPSLLDVDCPGEFWVFIRHDIFSILETWFLRY
jgi:hypothetical protein